MAVDFSKLARLEAQLEAREAALQGLSEAAHHAGDYARDLRRALIPRLPDPLTPSSTLAELVADLEALCDDPRQGMNARAALHSARPALEAESRAASLHAEHKRLLAEIAPLRSLVKACQAYAGASRSDAVSVLNRPQLWSPAV